MLLVRYLHIITNLQFSLCNGKWIVAGKYSGKMLGVNGGDGLLLSNEGGIAISDDATGTRNWPIISLFCKLATENDSLDKSARTIAVIVLQIATLYYIRNKLECSPHMNLLCIKRCAQAGLTRSWTIAANHL